MIDDEVGVVIQYLDPLRINRTTFVADDVFPSSITIIEGQTIVEISRDQSFLGKLQG